MARSRNIKPGFYKNEDLAECSIWARFIFPGLWMLADREGRLEDRPKRIKGELLPFDSQELEPLLAELNELGFIVRYENQDGRFIQITNFRKHQAPHFTEKGSVIPPPPDEGAATQLSKPVPEHWPPQTQRQAAMAMYFMHRGGDRPAIKIGVTGDIQARLRQVRSQRGHANVELLLAVKQTEDINERTLHRQFDTSRMDGEWFALSDDLNAVIESLKPHALPYSYQGESGTDTGADTGNNHVLKRGSEPPDSLIPDSLIPDSKTKSISPKNGSGLKHTVPVDNSKNQLAQKSNSKPQPDLKAQWWRSNAGIEATARALHVKPKPGETHVELKQRCFAKIHPKEGRHAS